MTLHIPYPIVHGRALPFTDFSGHETIWAIAAGPGGEVVHVAVCCENTGGGVVQLYAYDVATQEMRYVLDPAQALGEDPADGHASHGKVHFALCPARDGAVYAATHCSTPPRGDITWDAKRMWNHPEKSFTGGHLFRYRPDSDEFEDFGILFPNQGIPALCLDEGLDRLVGVTYPAANLFVINRNGSEFTNLGRVSEDYPLCLVLDGQGYAYTSDTYGFLIRVNIAAADFELLPTRIPAPRGATGMVASMSDAILGADGFIYCISYTYAHLFRFRPRPSGTLDLEDLGPFLPRSPGRFVRGLTFGLDGGLYACVYEPYSDIGPPLLARFDCDTRTTTVTGSLMIDGAPRRYWRAALGCDGRIYAGECGRRPVSLVILDPTATFGEGDASRPALPPPVSITSEQVDIVSINALRTPTAVAEMRHVRSDGDASVRAGNVYGVSLAWPPPALLPITDAAVTALGVDDSGEVWAATSGESAHVLWMPKPCQVTDLGVIPGTRRVAHRLVFDGNGRVYGAARDIGGQLFSCDTTSGVLWKYIDAPPAIKMHGPVFADDGVACIAISSDRTTVAGVGENGGRLFLRAIGTGTTTLLDVPGKLSEAWRQLAAGASGEFYGAAVTGELFRVTQDGGLDVLDVRVPDGTAVTSLALTRAGDILGGTAAGALFRFRPDSGNIIDCGRLEQRRCLRSLVETVDGRVFGVAGTTADLATLVCYCPVVGEWQDLGMLQYHGEFPWTAFRIGPLAAGRHGEIIAGENDRFGHVYMYHPLP